MKLYFVINKQFIGEIEIDETKTPIVIWNDTYMDYAYYELQSKNPSINATFMFKDWIRHENTFECIYYDINLNKIDKTIIDSIKYSNNYDFETDGVGNTYLYKTLERVQDAVLYNIYFGQLSNIKPYIEPEKNTGIITKYDEYGDITETFFHINGKINGEKITYYDGKTITNYVDGIKHGETIKYDVDDNIIEKGYYLNGKLEGDYIYYGSNDNIVILINFKLGKVYKITKFFDDGMIEVENSYNKDGKLESHKSFYDNDVKFLEIMYIDDSDSYKLTHYFENGNIAWKAMHKMAYHGLHGCGCDRDASRKDVQEIYNEDGIPITLNEFDKLYNKKQLKTDQIYDMYLHGPHNDDVLWSSFFNPYKFVEY